jgi:hypothetical protein
LQHSNLEEIITAAEYTLHSVMIEVNDLREFSRGIISDYWNAILSLEKA